jgi:hypothetical protein
VIKFTLHKPREADGLPANLGLPKGLSADCRSPAWVGS